MIVAKAGLLTLVGLALRTSPARVPRERLLAGLVVVESLGRASYILIVMLHTKYNKARLNDSTAYGYAGQAGLRHLLVLLHGGNPPPCRAGERPARGCRTAKDIQSGPFSTRHADIKTS